MTGVSVRVQRGAGDAADMLRRLAEQAEAARRGIGTVDDAIDDLKARQAERQRIIDSAPKTKPVQIPTAAEPHPATPAARPPQERPPSAPSRPAPPAPPSTPEPPAAETAGKRRPSGPAATPTQPGSHRRGQRLSSQEKAMWTQHYTPAELERATWLEPPTEEHPGRLLIAQPKPLGATRSDAVGGRHDRPARPRIPRPDPERFPPLPPTTPAQAEWAVQGRPPRSVILADPPAGDFSEGQAPRGRHPSPRERGRTDAEAPTDTGATAQAHQGLTVAKKLASATDRELRREWSLSQRQLDAFQRTIATTSEKIRELTEQKKRDGLTSRQQRELDEAQVRLANVRGGLPGADERHRLLGAEMQRRGMAPPGAPGTPPLGGGGAGALAQRLAGGMSGGPIGMGLAALRMLGPVGIVAGAAGGYAMSTGDAASRHKRLVWQAGLESGGGWPDIWDESLAARRHYVRPEEFLDARRALAQRTGRTDVMGVAATARAYGIDPGRFAGMVGELGTLGVLPRGRMVDFPGPPMAVDRLAPSVTDLRHVRAHADPTRRSSFPLVMAPPRPPQYPEDPAGSLAAVAPGGLAELRRPLPTPTPTPTGMGPRPIPSNQLPEVARRGERLTDFVSSMRRVDGGGPASIFAAGYRASAYHREMDEKQRKQLMQSYATHALRLSHQAQSAGGMLINDLTSAPAMLSAATRFFGPDVSPEIPATRVGQFVQAIQSPKDAVMRGIQLRAIRDMAERMSPEELERFKAETAGPGDGGVGIDLTTHAGRLEAMQRATTLPPAAKAQLLRVQMEGLHRATGKGSEAELFALSGMTGGQMGPARQLQRLIPRLLDARVGSDTEAEVVAEMDAAIPKAGEYGRLFMNELDLDHAKIAVQKPLKDLGQSILGEVMDFAKTITSARDYWNSSGAAP